MKYVMMLISVLVAGFCFMTIDPAASLVTMSAAGGVYVSTDSDRAAYERLRNFLYQSFGDLSYVITPTDLALEAVLDANSNVYQFNPYDNDNQARPQENRLSRNDMFCVTHLGLSITKQNLAANPKQYANVPLFTFPDAEVFDFEPGGAVPEESSALELIYQGKLSFNTSAQKRLENFLTHNCRYVPERGTVPATENTKRVYSQYGPNDESRGYKRIPINMLIDGQEDNRFELMLGSGNKAAIAGNPSGDTQNVLKLLVKGFKVSGVAFNKMSSAQRDQYRGVI